MASIRGKNTAPEIVVRRLVRALGYQYKMHAGDLPGTPDLVVRSQKKAVLINGCFWHRHSCRFGRAFPATRVAFWRKKLEGNRSRDFRNARALRRLGWKVLVVWECQTRQPARMLARIAAFLSA